MNTALEEFLKNFEEKKETNFKEVLRQEITASKEKDTHDAKQEADLLKMEITSLKQQLQELEQALFVSKTITSTYARKNTELLEQLTWRKVSEKPEDGQRVIILEKGRAMAVTYEIDDGDAYFIDDDGFECYPTKWLPIPKE